MANSRRERAEQETRIDRRYNYHGLTCDKRYQFRPDCRECLLEAWERMSEGGVKVVR